MMLLHSVELGHYDPADTQRYIVENQRARISGNFQQSAAAALIERINATTGNEKRPAAV